MNQNQFKEGDRVVLIVNLPDETGDGRHLFAGDAGTVHHFDDNGEQYTGIEFDRYPESSAVSRELNGQRVRVIDVCVPLPPSTDAHPDDEMHGDKDQPPATDQPTSEEVIVAMEQTGAFVRNPNGGGTLNASGQHMINQLLADPSFSALYEALRVRGLTEKTARLSVLFAGYAVAIMKLRNPNAEEFSLDYTNDERLSRLIQPAAS